MLFERFFLPLHQEPERAFLPIFPGEVLGSLQHVTELTMLFPVRLLASFVAVAGMLAGRASSELAAWRVAVAAFGIGQRHFV